MLRGIRSFNEGTLPLRVARSGTKRLKYTRKATKKQVARTDGSPAPSFKQVSGSQQSKFLESFASDSLNLYHIR